ncbi:YitT family protein [Haematobacter massiliensis]|uniref:Uncharacterized protein n=1 Tax=Haematobacter massiliensis TaxID=195105 RepID=A0A086YC96_9RHOB|nr:YitT family protein [Haematobacter massiliensis]KFI31896.1 hypothetical protein CN97_05635 [Haematobacter massiliensis]OWJ72499.1 YitT family protein [Haematobacter massiliensis]OWJ87853.1 YitT family protein [Haematobacter massiliensis]QBJ24289.1 YitT family protein [Haematobacter massiliensis]
MSEHDKPTRHTGFEDAQGILFGTMMCALGIQFLAFHGFMTGQTAGLALLISYATGWGFGPVFFLINLPFYWLGYRRIGLSFTLKSFASVALMSLFAAVFPHYLSFAMLSEPLAAVLFGCTTGAGLLALFRHGSSLGGVGVVALYLQDRTGIRAGWVQMGFDAALFAIALWWVPLDRLIWSVLGVVVVNLVIAINHRRDRYVAM